MALSSGTITGTLHGLDYGDNKIETLSQGIYDYTLTASGGGRLAFKVEAHQHVGAADRQHWVTVEEKSKVQSGTGLEGDFAADDNLNATCEIRFNFNREVLSDGVDYVLTFTKRS
jgi:hypothetical protein